MINHTDNYVAWALLLANLDEAREHLDSLATAMGKDGEIDESDFAVQLGHIYAHLNRVWHARNQGQEISDDQWLTFSKFPTDLDPVG